MTDVLNLVPTLAEAVTARDQERARGLLGDLHAADVARLVGHFDDESRAWLIESLPEDVRGEVLLELSDTRREEVLGDLSVEVIQEALVHLDSDDAADLLQDLDEEKAKQIVSDLQADDRREVEQLLLYGEETAGGLMQVELFKARENWPPEKVMDVFRRFGKDLERIHTIFLVDDENVLTGELAFRALILAEPERPVIEAANRAPISVHPEVDQEEVARLFQKYDVVSLPVVDHEGHLLGRITADDVLDVVTEEASEDIYRMGGVEGDDLEDPALKVAARRGGWLAINLLTAWLAAWVISFFESTIDRVVALAVIMPIVASMGGNAGTQTLTVVVRAMALGKVAPKNAWRVIRKQIVVNVLNGIVFAILMGATAAIWYPQLGVKLGLVFALAMVINLFAAGFAGSVIPLLLRGFGADPALASGILLTTVTDVVGYFAFLGLATVILL